MLLVLMLTNCCHVSPCLRRRHLTFTYGPSWLSPNTTYHGVDFTGGSASLLYKALLERLTTTVWGNIPWSTRHSRCQQLVATQQRSGVRAKMNKELFKVLESIRKQGMS